MCFATCSHKANPSIPFRTLQCPHARPHAASWLRHLSIVALDGSGTWLRPIKLMSHVGPGPAASPGWLGPSQGATGTPQPHVGARAGAPLGLPVGSGGSWPFAVGPPHHRRHAPQSLAAAPPRPCHNKGKHLWMETAGGSSRQHCCRISPETQRSASKRHLSPCSPQQTLVQNPAGPGLSEWDRGTE